MIWECRNKLNEVGKKNKVFLIWVPGHSGIKGNEKANTLAKKGARMSLIGPEPFCGIGKCTYKKFLEKEKAEREKLWWYLPGMDNFTKFLWTFETERSKDIRILVRNNYTSSLAFLQDTVASGSTCWGWDYRTLTRVSSVEGGKNLHSPSHGMLWHCEPKKECLGRETCRFEELASLKLSH